MARIQFTIDRKIGGEVTIVPSIQRIDPGDEILMATTTPGTALQWKGDSPFAPPAAESVFVLHQGDGSQDPLHATKTIDMPKDVEIATCGEMDNGGKFTPWLQGAGFPGTGPTNKTNKT